MLYQVRKIFAKYALNIVNRYDGNLYRAEGTKVRNISPIIMTLNIFPYYDHGGKIFFMYRAGAKLVS